MKLLIRHIILLIIFICPVSYSWAQYEGLDSNNRVIQKEKDYKDPYRESPKIYVVTRGLESMFNLSNNALLLEGAPYYGIWIKNFLTLAAGVHGSVASSSFTGTGSTSIGIQSFARLNVNRFFLQTEYRLSNMSNITTPNDRAWIGSPIVLLGISYDDNFSGWASVGLITNYLMAERSPFGAFVFRVGFTF